MATRWIVGIIWLVYAYFCYLMLDIMLQYIPYNTDVAFLQIKQNVISLPYYRLAFFTHVYTSMLVLPAGILQFSKWIRSHLPALHRSAGWMYSFVLLLFIAPSGFIMGIHANGGLGSQIAFCLLSILWIYFTLMALWKIKQRDMLSHQHFMIRSFALTLSAITLRGWKYVLVMLFHPHPMDVYRITAWLGWGLNLLIAEMMIAYFFSPKKIQAT